MTKEPSEFLQRQVTQASLLSHLSLLSFIEMHPLHYILPLLFIVIGIVVECPKIISKCLDIAIEHQSHELGTIVISVHTCDIHNLLLIFIDLFAEF